MEYSPNDDHEDLAIPSPVNTHAKAGNSNFAGTGGSPIRVTDVNGKNIQSKFTYIFLYCNN